MLLILSEGKFSMRIAGGLLGGLLTLALAQSALAGITVTSYSTVALTNAWAPVGGTQYFERQELLNVSPAVAQTSGDWVGTNTGGSTDTWHYVGASQATSTTSFDASSLTVTAAGSFAYEITTTAGFVDPRSASIFTPGAAANYRGFFEIDTTAEYSAAVQLNRNSGISLGSFEAGFIFNQFNFGTTPVLFQMSGTIGPGRYQVLGSTGAGAPNFPNGVNNFAAIGGFENLLFSVEVPEPTTLGLWIAMTLATMHGRGWRVR